MAGLETTNNFDFQTATKRLTPPPGVVIAESFEQALELWKSPEVKVVIIGGKDKIPEDIGAALAAILIGEFARTNMLATDEVPLEQLGTAIAKQLLDYDFAKDNPALFGKTCALFTRAANFFTQIRLIEGSPDPGVLMIGHNWPYNAGPHRDEKATMAFTLQGFTTMTFADSDIANPDSIGRTVRLKQNAEPYFVDLLSFVAIKANAPHGTPWVKGWNARKDFKRVSGVFN